MNESHDGGEISAHDAGTAMLVNRLRKNLRSLGKWARNQNIECYRLYDNDLPEYAFAIDCYGEFIHMAEYQAPASIAQDKVEARRAQALLAVQEVLGVAPESIILKSRQRQRGKQQYQLLNRSNDFFTVREGASQFWVNLKDYLDTGLFLDHRPVRKFIYENARGARFLNLFCYTATASVHAALGGAESSLSIDLSNTYLDWARKNFLLNKLVGNKHRLKRADCISYLESNKEIFDLIFLDPPTFSNSKRTESVLDIQRDHVSLISNAMKKLEASGLLIFSSNNRNFKFDRVLRDRFKVKDFSNASLDRDFQRNRKIHQAWLIRHS